MNPQELLSKSTSQYLALKELSHSQIRKAMHDEYNLSEAKVIAVIGKLVNHPLLS